ncbi:class I SAM-dependent methyltransferase [Alysiella filiformis]|nr:class I SAM-dependent methyltransferase [Alysiella filiformis]
MAYRNSSKQKPPQHALAVQETSAERIIKAAHQHTATVWQGDFHNAKQVLAAIKKRVRRKMKAESDPATAFHKHRMAQAQQSQIINMLLVEIAGDYTVNAQRAPDVQAALNDVFGASNGESFLLPLNQLLGFIGAHEWHKKGVDIAELGDKIHVPFGVFSPIRGEYLALVAQTRLPENCQSAQDIGTGSGVLAAILAKRGVGKIIATDNNPRAIACAQQNVQRLGLSQHIQLRECDLFADECVDLIVCNPPWLPAQATSAIETALYDPKHAMLKAVLQRAHAHLQPHGELWLIMSDLAEHLGLRQKDELAHILAQNHWHIAHIAQTQASHPKAHDPNDPLAFARSQERTFLYCLQSQK